VAGAGESFGREASVEVDVEDEKRGVSVVVGLPVGFREGLTRW